MQFTTGGNHIFAVGIDVSNGRSTAAVLQFRTNVTLKPFEVAHTSDGLSRLAEKLNGLDGDVRVVMEHTGRYLVYTFSSLLSGCYFLLKAHSGLDFYCRLSTKIGLIV